MKRPSKALTLATKFAQAALSPQINPPTPGGGMSALGPLATGSAIPEGDLALLNRAQPPEAGAIPEQPLVDALNSPGFQARFGGASPVAGSPGHDVWNMGDTAVAGSPGHDVWNMGDTAVAGSPGHDVWNMGDTAVGSLEDVAPAGMAGGQAPAWARPSTVEDVAPSGWAKGQTAPAWGAHDPGEAGAAAKKIDKISSFLAEHMFLPDILGLRKTASGLPREQDKLAMAMAMGSALAEEDLAPLRKLAMKVSADLMVKRALDISPEVAHALLSGGLGAAAGGLVGYGLSDKKNRGRNALLTAIAGGAGGAALGHHFSDQLPDVTGTRGRGGVPKTLEKFREKGEGAKAAIKERGVSQARERGERIRAQAEGTAAQIRATRALHEGVGRTRATGAMAHTIRQVGEGQGRMRQDMDQLREIYRPRSPAETAENRAALAGIMGRGAAVREGGEAVRAGAVARATPEARTPPEGLPTPGVGPERTRADLREMSPELLERERVDLSPAGSPMSAQRRWTAEADARSRELLEASQRLNLLRVTRAPGEAPEAPAPRARPRAETQRSVPEEARGIERFRLMRTPQEGGPQGADISAAMREALLGMGQ